MIMKKIALLFLSAVALQASAEVWTLDDCIDYAVEHNLTVARQRVSEQSGQLDITEARDAYLPTLSAGASESFSFGRGLTSANTYANRNTTSFGWNVNLQLPLFQGLQAYRREQLAKANMATLVERTEAARDDVTLNVMAAYLQVLYCQELREVAEHQAALSLTELERRKVLLENGKIAESEVYEARAQLASDSLTLVNSDNDVNLALLDLSQLLRLPADADFRIAPLTDTQRSVPSPESVYRHALDHNHSLVASRLDIAAADRQISLARAGYLPRLSFNLGLGSTYYNLAGEINPSFERQMRDNYSTSLGLSLSVPIFDAFSTRNSVRRAKLQRVQAELEYESAQDALYKSINQAYLQAVSAERKLASAITAVEASKVSFDAMAVKYEYGSATATEFEQAKTSYIKAAAEEVQARYERILRIRILEFYNR